MAGLLPTQQRIHFKILFVFWNGSAPQNISDLLSDKTSIRPLRSLESGWTFLVVRRIRSGDGKGALVTFWNALPDELPSIKILSTFYLPVLSVLWTVLVCVCTCMCAKVLWLCINICCLWLLLIFILSIHHCIDYLDIFLSFFKCKARSSLPF